MEFTRLRLSGFKSFVESTELVIKDGLTGIVGPNGCGKSNLVESLRWVMGENTSRNMRASSMSDVIFSGSVNRASRNMAEVVLSINNLDRAAPAAFNNFEELQVSRSIERDAGSVYRVNGREVRAKDVQLLFADASTGAHSPSIVSQGQIGELISAKPQDRRLLLEEAAGISGLHSRRHEAELKLSAVEQNLERLEDIISQLEKQLENLRRQTRQANRYKSISIDIRRTKALLFYLKWHKAKSNEIEAEKSVNQAASEVSQLANIQAQKSRIQASVVSQLPQLRNSEAKKSEILKNLKISLNQIIAEEKRNTTRKNELENQTSQFCADIEREKKLSDENKSILSSLEKEEKDLLHELTTGEDKFAVFSKKLQNYQKKIDINEKKSNALAVEIAKIKASSAQLQKNIDDEYLRRTSLSEQLTKIEAEITSIIIKTRQSNNATNLENEIKLIEKELSDLEQKLEKAIRQTVLARNAENTAHSQFNATKTKFNEIKTEARTLSEVLQDKSNSTSPTIIDQIEVKKGFENAIGAVLGEDLEVSFDKSAPAHWKTDIRILCSDPALPDGLTPLSMLVRAPKAIQRRLAQIGIVDQKTGDKLQSKLAVGQRLVSKQGDLWRWDGYCVYAGALTATAQKLAQKNRLTELESASKATSIKMQNHEKNLIRAIDHVKSLEKNEELIRTKLKKLQKFLIESGVKLSEYQRTMDRHISRHETLKQTKIRLTGDLRDIEQVLVKSKTELANISETKDQELDLQEIQRQLSQDRSDLINLKSAYDSHEKLKENCKQRLSEIKKQKQIWLTRLKNTLDHISDLGKRYDENVRSLDKVNKIPIDLCKKRETLINEYKEAEKVHKHAMDLISKSEKAIKSADKECRQALLELSKARETFARAEERLEANKKCVVDIEQSIYTEIQCTPDQLPLLSGYNKDEQAVEIDFIKQKLTQLNAQRDQLGPINLCAEDEQAEISKKRDMLVNEKDDLVNAIVCLRQSIQSLNREGRVKMNNALDTVNIHFQKLFTHLFGGGKAELRLVGSSDSLEAGLEIFVCPPGKRLQTITLLSGGEQALSVISLIFSVFLTNPSPICILDEVDAPLDDNNVERFCNLMDQMTELTNTRYIIITHNPITMSRVNQLFGVTMAEPGVSKIVSVDLQNKRV